MNVAWLDGDNLKRIHFETELAARHYMAELDAKRLEYSYYHESCCSFWVTIR